MVKVDIFLKYRVIGGEFPIRIKFSKVNKLEEVFQDDTIRENCVQDVCYGWMGPVKSSMT